MKKVLLFIFFTFLIFSCNNKAYADSIMIKDRSINVTIDKQENLIKVEEIITTGSIGKDNNVKFKRSAFPKNTVFDTNLPDFVAVLNEKYNYYTVEFNLESNSTYSFVYIYPCEHNRCYYNYKSLIDGLKPVVQKSKIYIVAKDESTITACIDSQGESNLINKKDNYVDIDIYSNTTMFGIYIYYDKNDAYCDKEEVVPPIEEDNNKQDVSFGFEYVTVVVAWIILITLIFGVKLGEEKVDDEAVKEEDNFKILERWYNHKYGKIRMNITNAVALSISLPIALCGMLYMTTHDTNIENIYGMVFFDANMTLNIVFMIIYSILVIVLGFTYSRYKDKQLKHEIVNGKLYSISNYSCTRKYGSKTKETTLSISTVLKGEDGVDYEYMNNNIKEGAFNFHDRKIFLLIVNRGKYYLDILL